MPATQPPSTHKLAAILHADVAGFSALMSVDEDATHSELRRCMDRAAACIREHSGRIIGTAGDAFLADFSSVLDAIAAAQAFQDANTRHQERYSADRRLRFRVGINLGEVIVDGDDIFGDGVNVAARIQLLAEAGGIVVSEAVQKIARGRVSADFEDLGEHRLKNIPEPVRVYALKDGDREARQAAVSHRSFVVMAAIGVAAIAIAITVWNAPRFADLLGEIRGPSAGSLQPLDQRPIVAVLPFSLAGAGEDKSYFSDGVAEDVISQLGRYSGLLVLSWNAVAPFRGGEPSLEQLSRDLSARYVVGGTIRRIDDRIRVSVQLTDAQDGVLLWSEKYEEEAADLFAVQDRISRAVVGALSVRVSEVERQRAFQKPTESLSAYERVLRGRELLREPDFDKNLDARALFREAIDFDPGYADAHTGLGWTFMADYFWGWSEFPDIALKSSKASANQAVVLDPENAGARALLAQILWLQGNRRRASAEITGALELNHSSPAIMAIAAQISLWSGAHAEAVQLLELSRRLDPNPRNQTIINLAEAHYFLGSYAEAIDVIAHSGRDFAHDPVPHAIRAAALARLGRLEEAAVAAKRAKSIYPFFDAKVFANNISGPEHAPILIEGLELAGLK